MIVTDSIKDSSRAWHSLKFVVNNSYTQKRQKSCLGLN